MSTKKVIQVKKARDFGGAISDTFSLFFQNIKLFAKVFMKVIAPIAVIGALGVLIFAVMAGGMGFDNFEESTSPIIFGIVIGVVYFVFLFLLMYCFIKLIVASYRFVKIKADDPEREVTVEELMVEVREKTMPLLGMVLLYVLLFVAVMAVVGLVNYLLYMLIGSWSFLIYLFVFPLFYYYTVATSMYLVVSYEENLDFVDSLKRSMYLVKNKWWLTFAATIAISMIASTIMSFVQYIPLIFITIGGALMPTEGAGLSIFIGIGGIITLIFFVGTLLLYVINFVFQSLWYYGLVEDKEGRSVINKINQIGEDDGELQYSQN